MFGLVGFLPDLGAFLLALALSLVLNPVAIQIARKFGLTLRPRLHSENSTEVTYLGGPVLAICCLAGALLFAELTQFVLVLMAALLAVVLIGYIDDRLNPGGIPPRWRLLLKLLVAAAAMWRGMGAGLSWWEVVFGVFVLVGGANVFNLIDNMDGVAGSSVLGYSAGLVFFLHYSGHDNFAPFIAALGGAALGFLRFNIRNAKVYLGDGGALFAGFLISAAALRSSSVVRPGWSLLAVVAILALPITDAWVALISRLLHRRPVFQGATDHISHRLSLLRLRSTTIAAIHGALALGSVLLVAYFYETSPEILVLQVALFAMAGGALMRVRSHAHREHPAFRRVFILALAIVLVGSLLLATAPSISAGNDLLKAKEAWAEVRTGPMSFDLDGSRTLLEDVYERGSRAAEDLDSPLTLPARKLPLIGSHLELVRALAVGTRSLAAAGLQVNSAAALFPREGNNPRTGLNGGKLDLAPWLQARSSLEQASQHADDAVRTVRAADGLLFQPMVRLRDDFLRQAEAARALTDGTAGAARILPEIFGQAGSKRWLLIIQNPVEARATGGFIGAFGVLAASEGRLTLERLDSNINLPAVPPDFASGELAQRYSRFAPGTTWQNVNMTPDFPSAAQAMLQMWAAGTSENLDGVLAVDAVGIAHLLKIVGPVQHPVAGQIDHENFIPVALNQAYFDYPDKADRVNFLLDVAQEVWGRLLTGDFNDSRVIARSVGDAVGGRHLQLYSPRTVDATSRAGVGGALRRPFRSDFLMVVAQNASGNKMDYYARRKVAYRVNIRDDRVFDAHLKVTVTNEGPDPSVLPPYIAGPYLPEDPAGLNRSYLSAYLVPTSHVQRAELNGERTGVESHTEKRLSVVSRFVEVMPGSQAVLELDLIGRTPNKGEYKIKVQKQPGLYPDEVSLEVVLPSRAAVLAASPGMKLSGRRVTWEGSLSRDKEFVVRFGSFFSDHVYKTLGGPRRYPDRLV